ncbi:MAG TPA: ice-binding family protein [bacterium]|nr:ice-binding family protein [bacterium]
MKKAHIVLAALTLFAGLEAGLQATATATPTASPTASPTFTPCPQKPLNLGAACGFGVLAGAAFTNTGTSVVSGDVGAQTESIPGLTIAGTNQQDNVLTASALSSLDKAYTAAEALPSVVLGNDLSSEGTVGPGVYGIVGAASSDNNTTLVLDAAGNTSAVFIFQITGGLVTGTGFAVSLTGGAQLQNVFWVVEGPGGATLGPSTNFAGTLIAGYAITLNTGANIQGSVLSDGGVANGAITIDGGSDITDETCPEPALTATSTASPSPTRTPDVTATTSFTASPSSTQTPNVTATGTFTGSPSPSSTPKSTATFTASPSPTSTADVTAGPSSTASPSPTLTADVTSTATPTVSATFYPTVVSTLTAIPLGDAADFSLMAQTEITNTGASSTNGYLGVNSGISISGSGTIAEQCTDYTGNSGFMAPAETSLLAAYNDAQGLTPTDIIGTRNIGGSTFPAGVYESASSILLNGTITLDGNGDSNAVFVFQAASGLTVAVGSQVILENGAQAKNVFWAVGSSAALKTDVDFAGTILAYTSITVGEGATINGSLLALHGDVTLENDAISTYLPYTCSDLTATPIQASTASASPTHTPFETSTPTFTASTSPTHTPFETHTPTSTASTSPTHTPFETPTPTFTASSSPTHTPFETSTPVTTLVGTPRATPVPASHSYFYPSPSRGNMASVAYDMSDQGNVTIRIYNQAAELVDRIDDSRSAGWQSSTVSVGRFAPGIYYYVLSMNYASGATEIDHARGFVVLH